MNVKSETDLQSRKYHSLSTAAVRAEKQGKWAMAAQLWTQAESHARHSQNQLWTRVRNEFCINADNRKWAAL